MARNAASRERTGDGSDLAAPVRVVTCRVEMEIDDRERMRALSQHADECILLLDDASRDVHALDPAQSLQARQRHQKAFFDLPGRGHERGQPGMVGLAQALKALES